MGSPTTSPALQAKPQPTPQLQLASEPKVVAKAPSAPAVSLPAAVRTVTVQPAPNAASPSANPLVTTPTLQQQLPSPITPSAVPVVARSTPSKSVRGVVLEFTVDQVTVYDRPYGQRLAVMAEKDFPRVTVSGKQGVPIYGEDGGVIEVGLPDGRTGWISKTTAVTTVPSCKVAPPSPSTNGRGGLVARGAGDAAC